MREIGHVAWSGTRAKSPRVRNRPPDLENLGRRFGPKVGKLYPFFFLNARANGSAEFTQL